MAIQTYWQISRSFNMLAFKCFRTIWSGSEVTGGPLC